jgi:hypothetical protein
MTGGLIDVFVVEIVFERDNDDSGFEDYKILVPGAFYYGEGDPSRLKLYLLDNELGRRLEQHFDIDCEDSLHLSSSYVDGSWPYWLNFKSGDIESNNIMNQDNEKQ